jgi:hypothetical protein
LAALDADIAQLEVPNKDPVIPSETLRFPNRKVDPVIVTTEALIFADNHLRLSSISVKVSVLPLTNL